MADQPIALRLADEVDEVAQTYPDMAEVSAELRRLYNLLEVANDLCRITAKEIERLNAVNQELLEVLVSFTKSGYIKKQHPKRYAAAVAAIAKAEGEKT